MKQLVAPFPYFGGKRTVAAEVWRRFGDVRNYVEPFFGSGAVLLAREAPVRTETVNDADGLLVNVWRAVRAAPLEVAHHADHPVSEADLTARHLWLVGQRESLTQRLEVDPEWYDARAAGWWVWGACAWIGTGWCSGRGPWMIDGDRLGKRPRAGRGVNRQIVHLGTAGQGINRKLPHLGNAGQGINRKLPHLGDAGQGINRKIVHLGNAGRGINRKLPHLGDAGRGAFIADWMTDLAARLRDTRIACGDWTRVVTPVVTHRHGRTAVFLDPPYDEGDVDYAVGGRVAADVRAWALEAGRHDDMRIALCGYSEHDDLAHAGWTAYRWKARGGYSSQDGENANAARETIWFSPRCEA